MDLGDFSLTQSGNVVAFVVLDNGELTLQNGSVEGKGNSVVLYAQSGKLITKDVTIKGAGGIQAGQTPKSGQVVSTGEVVIEEGTRIKTSSFGILVSGPYWSVEDMPENPEVSKLTINGGSIQTSDGYGITGNGNYHSTEILVNGGEIISAVGPGIYHPQKGSLILNGGTIQGSTGIQMCAGTVMVPGDSTVKVTGKGEDLREDKGDGDGNIDDGSALSLVDRGYPGGTPAANIQGGTFMSQKTQAVMAYTWAGGESSEWNAVGDYVDVSGGSFSSAVPEEYCADNFHPNKNADGTYSVHIHKKDEGTVTKPATASETGTRTYKCSICGEELGTEVIPALGSGGEENGEAKPGSGSSGSSSSGSSSSAQKSAVSEINSASTGDDSEILPWLLVLLVSAAGIASGLICQRKLGKKQKN